MRRFLLIIMALLFLMPSCVLAQTITPIELQVSDINPTRPPIGPHKEPIMCPFIFIENHTLYFDTPCDGCTLNIVDENDVVVYTLVIPSGTTSLMLPSILSGEYTIQIIRGNYLFYGTINLP